jgi:hypothetical protein
MANVSEVDYFARLVEALEPLQQIPHHGNPFSSPQEEHSIQCSPMRV